MFFFKKVKNLKNYKNILLFYKIVILFRLEILLRNIFKNVISFPSIFSYLPNVRCTHIFTIIIDSLVIRLNCVEN